MTQAPNMEEMPKAYEPGKVEAKWYDFWVEKGYFTPEIDPKKKPFVIIHPPTNITGDMHLGTAITATLEDIMVTIHPHPTLSEALMEAAEAAAGSPIHIHRPKK